MYSFSMVALLVFRTHARVCVCVRVYMVFCLFDKQDDWNRVRRERESEKKKIDPNTDR